MLRQRGMSVRATADAVDLPFNHVRSALYGRCRPSPELRILLSELLDVPVDRLFSGRARMCEWTGTRGRNGGSRRSA